MSENASKIDWSISENRFLLGDCMDHMAAMPDKCFDLAIVDPEYGIGVNHNMGRRKGDLPSHYKPAVWDKEPPPKEYFFELVRISRNQIIWGTNHFASRLPKLDSPCWIVWDKKFSEDISFAQVELAWTSFCSVSKKFEYSSQQSNRIHPTQKPVALYRWLLQNYAKSGWTILDTHGGSGSSAIACEWEGFTYTWIEKDADYYRDAKKRIEQWREGRTIDMFEKPKQSNGVQMVAI